jgi:CRP-like cAMP-binding protein
MEVMRDKQARLRASKLFSRAGDAWIERLAAGATAHRYAPGEALWRAGEPAASFVIVQRGLVQIVRRAAGGEAAMIGLFGPRESVGDSAVLERGSYPADAIAAGEVEVLRVRAAPVLDALPTEPALAAAIHGALLDHTRALRAKIDVMSAGAVPRRLAALFLHLVERFGDEDEEGTIHVPVTLSRIEIAHLVGARTETVIRALSRWQKSGVLRTTSEGFEITDAEALKRVLAGE